VVASTILWSDNVGHKVWSLSADMTFPNRTMAKLEPGLLFEDKMLKMYGIAAYQNTSIRCEPVKILRPPIEDVPDMASSNEVRVNKSHTRIYSTIGQ